MSVTQQIAPATTTDRLAAYLAQSSAAEVPAEIEEKARLHILDTLASIVACRELGPAVASRTFAVRNSGSAEVPILGSTVTASLVDAAFASAMTAHAAEINDFCPSAYVQPGPAVVSTALLLSRVRGASGRAMLNAVIAGYEVGCRMPKAIGAEAMKDTGVANHGVGSVFGSYAAAASVLRHSPEQISHGLSLTAQQASGSWQWVLDTDHIEKALVFAGMGARSGVSSALFVDAGFTGVAQSFDHPMGWFSSTYLAGERRSPRPEYLTEALGERFELPFVGFKQFPVGGPVQPIIAAMLALLARLCGTPAEHVASVRVELPTSSSRVFAGAGMPALNVPYLVAIMLLDGRLDFVGAQSNTRMAEDTAAHRIMERVELRADAAQDAMPRIESARVVLTLTDGTELVEFVEHVKGFPALPMEREDVVEKARELVAPHLGEGGASRLCDLVLNLETLADTDAIVALLSLE